MRDQPRGAPTKETTDLHANTYEKKAARKEKEIRTRAGPSIKGGRVHKEAPPLEKKEVREYGGEES